MFLCLQFLNKLKSWWQSPSLSTWNSPRWFLDAQKHCWRWAKKRFTNRTSNTTKTKSPIREKKVILGNSRDDPPWLLQADMRTLGELGRGNYFNWKGLERPLYSGGTISITSHHPNTSDFTDFTVSFFSSHCCKKSEIYFRKAARRTGCQC